MTTYQIVPISEEYIEGFCKAVDSVSRERKYLAFLEGPPVAMSRAFVKENLEGNWPHFVAISDGKVVGWCDITSLHRPVYAHSGVLGIGVIAEYRGKGIGEALMRAALAKAKAIGLTRVELTVREDNKAAYALYEKMGFVKEGYHRRTMRIDGDYFNSFSMGILLD